MSIKGKVLCFYRSLPGLSEKVFLVDFLFWPLAVVLVAGVTAALIAIDALVATALWPEIIPSLFPGFAEKGLIAPKVNFETMFWAIAALWVLKPANLSHLFSNNKGGKK
jgi:hypothetical protein